MGTNLGSTLLRLIGGLYDASLGLQPWSRFLGALEAEGGARVALFLPFPGDGDPGRAISASIRPELLTAYQRRYFALDPATAQVSGLPCGEVAILQGTASRSTPEGSTFEREWLGPQRLCPTASILGVIDRVEGGAQADTLVLRGFLPQGSKGFPRGQAMRWRMLMPHLKRALRIRRLGEQLAREQRTVAVALAGVPAGVLVLDRRGRVVAKNPVAERMLAARDGLFLSREGLQACGRETTERLQRAVKQASGAEGRSPSATLLPRPSGRRPLEVVAVGGPSDRSGTPAGGSSLLYVISPDEPLELSADILNQLFGLTPAEAALACQIAGGRSIEEAADRLGVTIGTARSRLKTIFLKTDTNRQAELVGRLLSGPAALLAALRLGRTDGSPRQEAAGEPSTTVVSRGPAQAY